MSPPQRRRARGPSPWVALFQLAATIGLLWGLLWGALLAWRASIPPDVTIPEVVGMELPAAQQLLKQVKLEGEVIAEKPSEQAAAKTILAAEPEPGRMVKIGRKVLLTVSLGSDWAKAPDVRKVSIERARELLLSRSVTPGRERAAFHDQIPAGYVIQQSPLPGTRLRRNSRVDLLISKGKRPPEAEEEEPEAKPEIATRKMGKVSLLVPPGAELQEVKIVVEDDQGARTVYEGFCHPGDVVTQNVSGAGRRVMARVYVSGELMQEKEL